ncbi:type I methionyl aminopeptidase [bacterium]|jgi:methionyl aminopeptidase|nr:type I methionyl aminopeptidase [bacterium]
MITIKNKQAIKKMEIAGQLLSEIFELLSDVIKPGVSTLEVDSFIEQQHIKVGLMPRAKGYKGYKHASCISLNDEVVHGVPSKDKVLKNGDLVKVDICSSWKGYCADMARCFFVGKTISKKHRVFVDIAAQALDAGIEKARAGNYLSDISAAIQAVVERHKFGILRDFAGHGIGKNMHEDPDVFNYGKPGQGPKLRVGMTLAIEPMITLGGYKVYIARDGWTVKTLDKSLAAHVEDTICVTEGEPRILTRPII